jgi:outer membrane protein insertion porin family
LNRLIKIVLIVFLTVSVNFAGGLGIPEVNSVVIEGNNSVPNYKLENILQTRPSSGWVSQFLYGINPSLGSPPVLFDSLSVIKDVHNIQNYYKSIGYFKSKVDYQITHSENYVDVKFIIDENQRSRINKLVLQGFSNLPEYFRNDIIEELQFDSTEYYSSEKILSSIKNINSILHNNGYILSNLERPHVLIDTAKNYLTVTLTLHLGSRVKISDIDIVNQSSENDYVTDDLILEIADVHSGDWFDESRIGKGEVRLYRTDLFNSSTINIGKIDTVAKKVPLNISVDLKPRNEIAPEIIANNEDNVFNFGLSMGYSRRNFFGDARKFNLQLSATAQDPVFLFSNLNKIDSLFYGYLDLRSTIAQPLLFGKSIFTKLQVYYTIQNRRGEYFSNIYGTRLSFDFSLPKKVYFSGLTAYLRAERSVYHYQEDYVRSLFNSFINNTHPTPSQQATLDSLKRVNLNNFQSVGSNLYLAIDATKNATNNFVFPTEGYSLYLHLEDGNNLLKAVSSLFSSEFKRPRYIKAIANATYYPELLSTYRTTLGLRLKVGEIYLINGNYSDIPLDERLYAGGSNSVRGWRNRELVPVNSSVSLRTTNPNDLEAILLRNFSPGGFSLLEGSMEYRAKLFGNFGGVVFTDWGNTWIDFKYFRWDEIAVAGGFGIRYYTSFFPIRFDFGFKLYDPGYRKSFFKKRTLPETFTFHIGIGEAF